MSAPAAALLALAVLGCGRGDPPPAPPRPPPEVTVAPVVVRTVPVYLDEIGKCVAPEVVSIEPQVSGRITDVHFKDGADLRRGDPLFTIDPRPFEARLAQEQATLAQNRALLEMRRTEYEKTRSVGDDRAISKLEVEQRKNAVAVAEAAVAWSESAVATARLDVEYTKIVSPLDGRAGRRLVDPGNVVNASEHRSLLVIERLDPLYAELTIPEVELSRVRRSMAAGPVRAEVRAQGEGAGAREGEVTFLDNAVEPGSGTVRLRATLANADRVFWPGQFVDVRLTLDVLKDGLLVPANAPQIGQKGPFIYVLRPDSTVEQRPIEPRQRHGDLVVVARGVSAGERVVATGQMMLYPGAHVTVNETPKP